MLSSLLTLYGLARADTAEACEPEEEGIVFKKYYIDGCGACNRVAPVVEKLVKKLAEQSTLPVKYREVECNERVCCGVKSFPTFVVTTDKKETARTLGYQALEKLGPWLAKSLGLSSSFFSEDKAALRKLADASSESEDEAVKSSRVVKELVARDFLSGFDGQWLILFYENASDPNRESFRQLARQFGGKMNIAEVHKKQAATVTNRFNVSEYPHIVGLNHGNVVPYVFERTLPELRRFVARLARPSFESLTYKQLLAKSRQLRSGEPVYVVLYKNYELASNYFNDTAQQFKFRAVIYKSDDPAMFEAAGMHPMNYSDFEEHVAEDGTKRPANVDHNQMVKLLVYKNNTFYPANIPLDDSNGIVQWIFHTHFAHVTSVNNDNFYTVFHGIKPVMILLTENDQHLDDYNRYSAERHLGTPYLNVLFATIDVGEYPLFKKQVLPLASTPSIAFYDPINIKWYMGDKSLKKMSSRDFQHELSRLLEAYSAGKLEEYPPKAGRRWGVYGLAAWAVLIVAYFALRSVANRNKVD
ncbi:hypothetical protein PAPHI01_1442 [Pancytospora philotis]|nr:hypothetical protein PAPHI01_1442 [Pancytospora philotis]